MPTPCRQREIAAALGWPLGVSALAAARHLALRDHRLFAKAQRRRPQGGADVLSVRRAATDDKDCRLARATSPIPAEREYSRPLLAAAARVSKIIDGKVIG
jgi:hypothetical protein